MTDGTGVNSRFTPGNSRFWVQLLGSLAVDQQPVSAADERPCGFGQGDR
jgi:hypothetical protein